MLPEEVMAEPAALLLALCTRTKVGLNCVPTLWRAMLQAIESGHAAIAGRKSGVSVFRRRSH